MRKRNRSITILGLIALTWCAGLVAPPSLAKAEVELLGPERPADLPVAGAWVPIAKVAMPAVVNIAATRRVGLEAQPEWLLYEHPFLRNFLGDDFARRFPLPRERREHSLGSGVIVESGGFIVTNYHVVAQAEQIEVVLGNKRVFQANVVGADPKTDVAVIKIDAQGLPSLSWGDSDQLDVGESVLAIGNPFGLNQTVTFGIVSAVGRANMGIADYEDFIQTDAAINPGNSGGALINARGELVGINTAIFSQNGGYMGIGFAVPSNMVRSVMYSLIEKGRVVRGWLGLGVQEMTPELAQEFGLREARGALVTEVLDEGPAAQAGIRPGDIITRYNGTEIGDAGALRNLVADTPIGRSARVQVVRHGRNLMLEPAVVEQPQQQLEERGVVESSSLAGLAVQDLTAEISEKLGLGPESQGVVVANIEPRSRVASAGLRPGDVIREINRRPIVDTRAYERVMAEISRGESVLLLATRRGGTRYVVIPR